MPFAGRVDPLHELEGDPFRAFEEAQPPADVVHLVAEHGHAVGDQVRGHRLDVVDAEREVVVAAPPPVRRVLARIVRRRRIEFEQLDLEARLGIPRVRA